MDEVRRDAEDDNGDIGGGAVTPVQGGITAKTAALRVSFDNVTEIYDRVRHSYPPQAFADLFAYLREAREAAAPDVLEIGPGTGKATRALLDAGARVVGVEIGERMADFLRGAFSSELRLTVVEGAFEEVELPAGSFDVILAATSFHWVDTAVRLDKSAELLRPSGVLATLSTVQVESEVGRGFFERTAPIYARYHESGDHGYVAPAPEEATPPELAEMEAHSSFGDVTLLRYRWDQTYSSVAYADLLRSYSNVQVMEPGDREGMIAELCEMIDREFDGYVVRPLVIALAMARRSAD
jgi:SAM-dependent methyltransferase